MNKERERENEEEGISYGFSYYEMQQKLQIRNLILSIGKNEKKVSSLSFSLSI